jgi:hypothetical protein
MEIAMKRHTLFDVVKTAEDAGLDAQITTDGKDLVVLATERGPRRDAGDYFIRTSVTILAAEGHVLPGDFERFAESCASYVASRMPKASDKWFKFSTAGRSIHWGFGTKEQAVNYMLVRELDTDFEEVAGEPDEVGATVFNLAIASKSI